MCRCRQSSAGAFIGIVEYGRGLAGVVVYGQHVGAVARVAVAGGVRYALQDSNAKDWNKDGPIVQAQKIG